MVPIKGVLFDVVQEVVAEILGDEAWDRAIDASGLEGAYTSLGNYPDAEMHTLVALLADEAGLTGDETLRVVGVHAYKHLKERQPDLVADVSDLGQMLHSLNEVIHPEVRKLYVDASVPDFVVDDLGPGRWSVTYESERRMCHLAEGLIVGAGVDLGTEPSVTHTSCVAHGDEACVLEVVTA